MVNEKSLKNLKQYTGTGKSPGRPPGAVSIVSALRRRLQDNPQLVTDLVDHWLNQAKLSDNPALFREILDRIDGKVPQALTGANNGPLEVIVRYDGNERPSAGVT